jgi:hypothetical protein
MCVCVYHVDLKYVYKHILLFTNHFMKNKLKKFKLSLLLKLLNNEDSNAFSVKLPIFWLFLRFVNLCNFFFNCYKEPLKDVTSV